MCGQDLNAVTRLPSVPPVRAPPRPLPAIDEDLLILIPSFFELGFEAFCGFSPRARASQFPEVKLSMSRAIELPPRRAPEHIHA